jgi:surfeit locus 1 family protein
MNRQWPVVPTIFVACACATMIALGIWQLGRAQQRDQQAVIHATNSRNPDAVAFPRLPPIADSLLYRASSVTCLEVGSWEASGGTAADGTRGFRFIASCRTGAEGPGALVDMGVSTDPEARPRWTGGTVNGRITLAPQESGMFGRLFRTVPPARPLLVADRPAPGLQLSAPPDPTTQGNSSWAYAIQWFVFAGAAAVIYVLALRRKRAAPAAR